MYRFFASIPILSVAVSISGCQGLAFGFALAGAPCTSEQKFIFGEKTESNALAAIKTIALLDVPDPQHYILGWKCKNTREFGDFNFGAIAGQRLTKHLVAKGYHVIVSSISRHNQYKLVDDYQSLNISGADAFLDMALVEVGFKPKSWAYPFASEVGPHVSLVVKLVSADSKRVLYAESAQYGYDKNPFVAGIRIDSPPDEKFKNVDALKADRQRAIEQLMVGIDAISQAIAEQLAQ